MSGWRWLGVAAFAACTGLFAPRVAVAQDAPITSAPVLIYPAAFATGAGPSLTFRWNQAGEATSYQMQVASVGDFSALVRNDTGITETSRAVTSSSLNLNREYYWRVRGWNSLGAGPWSEARAFTTPLNSNAAPTLHSPADQASGVSTGSPTLSWAPLLGAARYKVQVSIHSNFSNAIFIDSTTGTSVTPPNLAPWTQYYWRVQAHDGLRPAGYSAYRLFITGAPVSLLATQPRSLDVSTLRVGGEMVVRLTLPKAEKVTLRWRELRGRSADPVRDQVLSAGSHSLRLPAAPAGVGVLEVGIGSSTQMLLVHP